jgi:AMMECR1 domain-containing protein
VTAAELKDIDVEISVLSKPRRVKDASEIQLGKHGVIVSDGNHQGVFLPQVAD